MGPSAPDSASLQDCLLTSTINRGVYEQVGGKPSPEIAQLATDAGASLFRVVREGRGLVYGIVLSTPEAAEALMPGMQPTLGLVAANLGAPSKPASGNEGPVAFGVIPLTPSENRQKLRDDVGHDITDCLGEVAG